MNIKTRCFQENNYKGIYFNGKTMRLALDSRKPITELEYPEFYDVKITSKCFGECPYCYQSSVWNAKHAKDPVKKIQKFFGSMTENQKPFQVAIGGGEPTLHPEFPKILRTFKALGIAPNYTTNGMWIDDPILARQILIATKMYCEGVAISCHPHLQAFWEIAAQALIVNQIFTNFHLIISDRDSIDSFLDIYNTWKGQIKYFVLLPIAAQGRCEDGTLDWDYLSFWLKQIQKDTGDISDIAFGANFYPYLKKDKSFPVSLYEPEILSKYLDLETMKIYPSSFSTEEI